MALLDLPLFVGASVIAAFGVRWAAATATWWTLLVTVGLAIYATVTREAGAGVVLMSGAAAASVVSLFLVRDGRVPTQAFLRDPLRFREADATAPVRRHVVATSVQLVLFRGAALGVVPVVLLIPPEAPFDPRERASVCPLSIRSGAHSMNGCSLGGASCDLSGPSRAPRELGHEHSGAGIRHRRAVAEADTEPVAR
ncbi:hypothetical protein [Microbacterium binotii]|uniref:Uncharacterized protein n=1 Tax=Microbacterium binotii TaxID=462710 RepID=A0ABN3PEU8_9MICO